MYADVEISGKEIFELLGCCQKQRSRIKKVAGGQFASCHPVTSDRHTLTAGINNIKAVCYHKSYESILLYLHRQLQTQDLALALNAVVYARIVNSNILLGDDLDHFLRNHAANSRRYVVQLASSSSGNFLGHA